MKLQHIKTTVLGVVLSVPMVVHADAVRRVYTLFGPIDDTGTMDMLQIFVERFMAALYVISISLAVLMIIVSGFQYMTAGADEKAIKAAKERLEYAIIGLIIVITSTLIYSQVFKFFY